MLDHHDLSIKNFYEQITKAVLNTVGIAAGYNNFYVLILNNLGSVNVGNVAKNNFFKFELLASLSSNPYS